MAIERSYHLSTGNLSERVDVKKELLRIQSDPLIIQLQGQYKKGKLTEAQIRMKAKSLSRAELNRLFPFLSGEAKPGQQVAMGYALPIIIIFTLLVMLKNKDYIEKKLEEIVNSSKDKKD